MEAVGEKEKVSILTEFLQAVLRGAAVGALVGLFIWLAMEIVITIAKNFRDELGGNGMGMTTRRGEYLATEHEIQRTFVEWCELNQHRYPELKWLYHVPNGELRDKATAARLKRLGVKRGIPDLALDVARGGYHGLKLEFKSGTGRPTPEQEEYMGFLKRQGYAAFVCRTVDDAILATTEYLKGKSWDSRELLEWVAQKHATAKTEGEKEC